MKKKKNKIQSKNQKKGKNHKAMEGSPRMRSTWSAWHHLTNKKKGKKKKKKKKITTNQNKSKTKKQNKKASPIKKYHPIKSNIENHIRPQHRPHQIQKTKNIKHNIKKQNINHKNKSKVNQQTSSISSHMHSQGQHNQQNIKK
jgi:hypothetical protein